MANHSSECTCKSEYQLISDDIKSLHFQNDIEPVTTFLENFPEKNANHDCEFFDDISISINDAIDASYQWNNIQPLLLSCILANVLKENILISDPFLEKKSSSLQSAMSKLNNECLLGILKRQETNKSDIYSKMFRQFRCLNNFIIYLHANPSLVTNYYLNNKDVFFYVKEAWLHQQLSKFDGDKASCVKTLLAEADTARHFMNIDAKKLEMFFQKAPNIHDILSFFNDYSESRLNLVKLELLMQNVYQRTFHELYIDLKVEICADIFSRNLPKTDAILRLIDEVKSLLRPVLKTSTLPELKLRMSQVKNEKDAILERDCLRQLVEYNAPLNSLPNNIWNADSSELPKIVQQHLVKNSFPDVSNELSLIQLIDLVFVEDVKGVIDMTKKELTEIYNQIMDELSAISDYKLGKMEELIKAEMPSNFCTRLAYIIQIAYLHFDKKCRTAQILAVILAHYKPSHRSRVLQINTGEGKTLIIAIFAVLKAMDKHKVDIITTSKELVETQSKEYAPFYKIFKLSTSNNIVAETKPYICDIVYGTIHKFKHHTLLDIMDKKRNTKSDRECDFAIVDEVDSVMVDQSLHFLYISNGVPGMFHLLHILGAIWTQIQQISNIVAERNGEWYFTDQSPENNSEEEENIIDEPIESFYNRCTLDYMKKLLRIEEPEEKKFPHLKYPKFLKYFVETQLCHWVDSATEAKLYYRLGYHYVLHEKKITIVEARSTGSLSHGSQWSNGLHQFLQMKHGCKVTPENLVSNFISNVTYLQRYGTNLIGLTGTIGGEADRELMNKAYTVDCAVLPPFKEPRHVPLTPIIGINRTDWLNKVVESVSKKLNYGQAALVLANYIQEAEDIAKMLQIKHGLNVLLYTRNSESKVAGEVLDKGEVIVATNIAGRGTDISVTEEVENSGGLHVCVTFLPVNCRVEKQNVGRTSRKGNRGTSQFVILHENSNEGPTTVLHTLREQRDNNVKEGILATMKEIDIVKEKDGFFKRFCDLKDIIAKKANDEKKPFIEAAINEWFGYWILHKKSLPLSEFEEFEKLCLENPDETIIKNPFILVRMSKAFISKKKYKEANDYLSKAIELDPDNTATAYYWRGFCRVALYNENVKRSIMDEAIDDFRRARKIIKSDYQSNLNLIITGHKDESIELQDELGRYKGIYAMIVNSIDSAVGQEVGEEIDDLEKALDDSRLTKEEKEPLRERRNYLVDNRANLENGELIKARKNGNGVKIHSVEFEKLLPAEERRELYKDAIEEIQHNGFYHVFVFNEKPPINWWNVIGLAIIGFFQLIAGAVVTVFTAGIGSSIGVALMAEGAFDLVAAVKDGIINRDFNWANWGIQKAIGLAISVVCFGLSALKSAASGAIRAVKTAANFGKEGVKQTAKVGIKTSAKLMGKEVAKTATKKFIAEPLIDSALSNTIEEPLQKKITDDINEIVTSYLKDDPNAHKLIECDRKARNYKYAKKLEEKLVVFLDRNQNVYLQLGRDIMRSLEGRVKGLKGKILTAILKGSRYAEVIKEITEVMLNLPKWVKEIANSKECEQDYTKKEVNSSDGSVVRVTPINVTFPEFCQHISSRASTLLVSIIMGKLKQKLSSAAVEAVFKDVTDHVNKEVKEFHKNHAGVHGNFEELDTKLDSKLRMHALKLEEDIKNIKNGGPASVVHIESLAHTIGRQIIVLDGSETISFGESDSNLQPIVIRFERDSKGEVGHYTLANGKEVKQSGKNNCLFDAVAAEIGIDADELRYQTASTMTNNYKKFVEAELKYQDDTRKGGAKLSKSASRHIYPTDTTNYYSDDKKSDSANEKALDKHEREVEANRPVRRPRKHKNQKTFKPPKGQPRTTLFLNDFDNHIEAEFNDRFDNLIRANQVKEDQRSTYEMDIGIRGKVKGCQRMSVEGELSSPQWIWVENPAFVVKGGEAVHYKHDHPNTHISERVPTRMKGPRTNYKGDIQNGAGYWAEKKTER